MFRNTLRAFPQPTLIAVRYPDQPGGLPHWWIVLAETEVGTAPAAQVNTTSKVARRRMLPNLKAGRTRLQPVAVHNGLSGSFHPIAHCGERLVRPDERYVLVRVGRAMLMDFWGLGAITAPAIAVHAKRFSLAESTCSGTWTIGGLENDAPSGSAAHPRCA